MSVDTYIPPVLISNSVAISGSSNAVLTLTNALPMSASSSFPLLSSQISTITWMLLSLGKSRNTGSTHSGSREFFTLQKVLKAERNSEIYDLCIGLLLYVTELSKQDMYKYRYIYIYMVSD